MTYILGVGLYVVGCFRVITTLAQPEFELLTVSRTMVLLTTLEAEEEDERTQGRRRDDGVKERRNRMRTRGRKGEGYTANYFHSYTTRTPIRAEYDIQPCQTGQKSTHLPT